MKGSLWASKRRGFSLVQYFVDKCHAALIRYSTTYLLVSSVQPYVVYSLYAERDDQQGHSGGFTIVETLVVLAVTGFLFAMAVLLIAGKQDATQFSHAVREVQSQVQQSFNEVSTGYYQNTGNLKCVKSFTGPVLSSTVTELGTNKGCIYLGKVLQFDIAGSDPEQYNVYTLVGLRDEGAGTLLNLVATKPRVVAKGTTEMATSIPDNMYDTRTLLNGLTVTKMYYDDNPANAIGAVAFASSIGSLGASDNSQQVNVVAIPATQLNRSKADGVTQINAGLAASVINPPNGVQICFRSGGTDQSALMKIGGGQRLSSVELTIMGTVDCT